MAQARADVRIVDLAAGGLPRATDAGERSAVHDHRVSGLADRDSRLAPLSDDLPLGAVGPEAHQVRRVRAEQASERLGHDVEQDLGLLLGRDGDRDAAERGLLVHEGLERLFLPLPLRDVAHDRDDFVGAAPHDPRLEVADRLDVALLGLLDRVLDDLCGALRERPGRRALHLLDRVRAEDVVDRHAHELVGRDGEKGGLAEPELEEGSVA